MKALHRSVFIGAILCAALLAFPACGRTFLVSNLLDSTNVTSLRGAIIAANARAGDDRIVLAEGVHVLTIQGVDDDLGLTGDLDIRNGTLTIVGTNVTINAAGLGDRVFHILPGARVIISGLVITGGNSLGAPARSGGGICNIGRLTLNDCTITGNAAGDGAPNFSFLLDGGVGGGIYNLGGLTLKRCVVENNSTGAGASAAESSPAGNGGSGAGIYNDVFGTMTLSACTVRDNTCGNGGVGSSVVPGSTGGEGGNGGGIFNSGVLTVKRCVVEGNSAGDGAEAGYTELGHGLTGGRGGSGGGILNLRAMTLKNTTVSGNASGSGAAGGTGLLGPSPLSPAGNGGDGGLGGGICNSGGGIFTLTACTVANNSCGNGGEGGDVISGTGDGGDGGNGGSGGGIANTFSGKLKNTLVALNSAGAGGLGGTGTDNGVAGSQGSGPDLAGVFSGGYNLVARSNGSSGLTHGANANIIGSIASPVDPLIGPLQNNGGLTRTHALLPGSPAIDKGRNFDLRKDQRGNPRPQNFEGIPNARRGRGTDIGAFEVDN